ncbi:MAG: hypothetical protein LBQ22_03190 [Bacteroidales bacterium]|jgi:hypothetical protein|nr:hypothetical protein [Bacteroidales bacterium]
MNIEELLKDKTIKSKEKTEILAEWLLNKETSINELLSFASKAKETDKATCIEAIEHVTKLKPEIANERLLDFITSALTEKTPRIKWESARIIGNIAHMFPDKLDTPIKNLIDNTDHSGTVVRWSSAYALGEILKLKTNHNSRLKDIVMEIVNKEEKNSIKKIYSDAIKKI